MFWIVFRWILAIGCMATSVKLMNSGLALSASQAAIPVIGSLLLFVATVLLVAPETAVRLAEWTSRPFAAILFPEDRFTRPPLTYRLARRYRDEHRWHDAATQYKKIIRYYPDEMDAYLELLQVAGELGDEQLRKKYTALFRKRFDQDVKDFEPRTKF